MDDYSQAEVEAYYRRNSDGETIRLTFGTIGDGGFADLDIRDAVFLRFQLDGAIDDYTKAAGR